MAKINNIDGFACPCMYILNAKVTGRQHESLYFLMPNRHKISNFHRLNPNHHKTNLMKIIRNILTGLVIIFALLIITALFLPSERHTEASVLVKAPAAVVYGQVDNFINWRKWSPWAVRDSQMVSTYEGPVSGIGAITRWDSPNKQNGYGSMEIKDADPYKVLKIELRIMDHEPSLSPWSFEETPEGTKVTWGLDQQNMKLLERYIGLFMQKMMDPYFTQGLDSLKAVSERLAPYFPNAI
jgi:hypothetical protein